MTGVEEAWQRLATFEPADVCRRALVVYDERTRAYRLISLGQEVRVLPHETRFEGGSPTADLLLGRFKYFSHLSILWYLLQAQETPLAGALIRPEQLKSGHIYAQGTHVLPLAKIARRFGDDLEGFKARGRALGAEPAAYADAALRLTPFPRLPLHLLLWRGDEEFPARADLLFDAGCEAHQPEDVLWSTAMMTLLSMLA